MRGNLPIRLVQLGTALLVLTVIVGFAACPTLWPRDERGVPAAACRDDDRPFAATSYRLRLRPRIAMSWNSAGGLIVHPYDLDPLNAAELAQANGFGWIAVQLADGEAALPSPSNWIARFRAVSGIPIGGWSVLRGHPEAEARLAATLLAQDGLDFYIADAEQEYGYTNGAEHSLAHQHRSGQFIAAFRALEPAMPSALTSFCRPDEHDLDWSAWADAGFAFLPQAYVDQLGADGTPTACTTSAAQWFPRSSIHPVLGVFAGTYPTPTPYEYVALLEQAEQAASRCSRSRMPTRPRSPDTVPRCAPSLSQTRLSRRKAGLSRALVDGRHLAATGV